MKMNGKKLSKFQFHFPGFNGFPDAKTRNKKSLIIGHWRWTGLRGQILGGEK
jgi:hypothetical protein